MSGTRPVRPADVRAACPFADSGGPGTAVFPAGTGPRT